MTLVTHTGVFKEILQNTAGFLAFPVVVSPTFLYISVWSQPFPCNVWYLQEMSAQRLFYSLKNCLAIVLSGKEGKNKKSLAALSESLHFCGDDKIARVFLHQLQYYICSPVISIAHRRKSFPLWRH